MNYSKILITGGCGFLGRYLVKELLKIGDCPQLRVLDLRAGPDVVSDFAGNSNIEALLDKDICDYDSIAGGFEGIGCVIHLAGVVSFSLKDKDLLHEVNVRGTENVLKAAESSNVKNFIHISSVAALGYNDDRSKPINEDFKFDWRIAERRKKYYMLTKHLADMEVEKYRSRGKNAVVLYPGLMFGPGDVTNSARLIRAINRRKIPFNMPGGTNIVDVRDVAGAISNIVQRGVTTGSYLLSAHNLTFSRINETIAKELGVKAPTLTMPRFLNPAIFRLLLFIESIAKNKLELTADNLDSAFKFRYFDNTGAKQQLGFEPGFSFAQTIEDTIKWMNANGLFD